MSNQIYTALVSPDSELVYGYVYLPAKPERGDYIEFAGKRWYVHSVTLHANSHFKQVERAMKVKVTEA